MKHNYSTSLYIGETSQGLPMPVFFDPHTQVINDNPPGSTITGQPGSGKTFLAMTLTAMSAIVGKVTVVLDPKGDFVALQNLQKDIGRFNFWNLADKRLRGLLDPFRMAKSPGEQLDLALTLIELFTGGISGEEKTALAPILKDVAANPNPGLGKVVQELRGSQREAARNLGTTLDLLSNLPLAGLCFAQSGANIGKVSLEAGLTVITLVGMDMPKQDGVQDNKSRLATGILFLITDFIRRLVDQDSTRRPKTIVIDEAWSVLQTPAGASMIKELSLLGRSRNAALILVTQNNSHLKHLDIDNTIRTRFAFKTDEKDAESLIKDMGLPEGEGLEGKLMNLQRGECLMQDFMGRYSTVEISSWNEKWATAFKTNPLEKARAEKARQQASES